MLATVVALYNKAVLRNPALYGRRRQEVLRKRVAVLVAAAMMVLSMFAAAAPAFAQDSAAENQYDAPEFQYAPPAGQNPDAGRIEAPLSDGNGATGLSDASLIEALSNTIWTVSGSGGGSATCAPGGAWGGMAGWPGGCFTGPDETVIPGSTPGSASANTGLVPSYGDSSVFPGYEQNPVVAFPGWGMNAPFDPCGIANQIAAPVLDARITGGCQVPF
jgi:hypothetical protein